MLRKLGIIAVLSLIVVALAAIPALGARPHTVPSGEPITCTLNQQGDTVTCGGELAGLGNVDFIDVLVDLPAGCATRGNENEPPGHVQVLDEDIPVDKSGRATFSTDVSPDCPRGLNEVFGDEATITVFEAGTNNVLFTTTVPVN